ncbi:type II secretion system F family protein [Actinoplanes sp. LDG1-06]|uniref:Type II secretion system F family protein n=1 Tax=Paractinoplanes ovalisporus TaxID=2810368 RepID=A0ABS2AM23_9ACTN|nr:type II secretion system F family protein [Actinoplanes ovalisporus]MBM2620254.1 type II secretion system F family protein [Actinoplanes ovalisporus]
MSLARWAIALPSAAAAFLLFAALIERFFGRTPMQRRLTTLKQYTVGERQVAEPLLRRLQHMAGAVVDGSPGLAALAARSGPKLEAANTGLVPSEWLAVRFLIAVLAALAGMLLLPALLGLLAGLLLGFLLPAVLLNGQIARRRKRFADELPAMLQLILSALRSGFTLQQSVEAAVRDDEGPVAEEFSRALSETRISGEFEDALGRAGERVESKELEWLVMALRLQRETGGSLAEVMQTTAETMRERAYLRRHVRTLSAEGRMSAYVLIALPVFTSFMLFMLRRDYIMLLFTQLIGNVMLGVAVLMLVIGSVWLRAITKIEV